MAVGHLRWTELEVRRDLDVDVNRHVVEGGHVPHDHDFVEMVVVLGGSGVHETVYRRDRVGRGDAFVIRPGAWHAYDECEGLSVINCCFRRRLLERELLWLAEEPRLRFVLWTDAGAGDGVVRMHLPTAGLTACEPSLERLVCPTEASRPHQLAHLLLLLSELARHLDPDQLAEAERLAAAPAGVALALQLMSEDLRRAWTMDDLAAAVAISPAHLTRLFRRIVRRPPMAHLSALRMEAAATRLLRSDEPVSAVAAAVGWGDPNYFTRRFRAHFGMSPTAFRRGPHQRRRW